MKENRFILPEYPKTPYLPYERPKDFPLDSPDLIVQEKVDGGNVRILWQGEDLIVGNREHILQKGYIKKNTPAKLQFRPLWNYIYENRNRFEKLHSILGFQPAVYGEWCLALHGIVYDKLPDWFIAFDLLDPENGQFVDTPFRVQSILKEAGFAVPRLIHAGPVTWELLLNATQEQSAFSSTDQVEGIYVKDKGHRCWKMIRAGYTQGCRWNDKELVKQRLA